ncbi:BspA family leucine-rich repeat surface protein [Enterococcus hirae]|nr:BspA family leucine-rich repeat surface protein [Enterococcus hirae]
MSKKKLTAKRKKQLLTMFAVAGVMGNAGIAPTMALADTLTPTAETATEQTQANEAKEVIDQTIQNVTDPLVNPTDSTTTASDSLATTEEATDETTDDTQDQATAPTAESEEDATNPTAEAPKVAQTANVATTSEITGTWGTSPYTFDENTGVLTIGAGELSGYKESPWNSKKVDAKSIKKIVLSGKVVAPEDSRRLFSYSYLTNVTEIEGLSQLDTSNVTNMEYMFHGMRSVTSLDVSGFDTSNVTNMDAMFYSMSNVTSLDVSGFDTSKVTEMAFMFDSMSRLTSLDLNSFDTSKVTVMDSMFFGMQSLTSLDISGFDTSNVAYMGDMFRRMSSLTSLDLSNFDTSKVTDMGAMFADTPLKKLILGDSFKFVESGSENAKLTSAWKRADGKGKVYTAADFMKNYGTGDLTAGTYVSATGWWGTSPYNFDENTGTLTIEAGELSGYEKSPWNSGTVDYEAIKKIVLSGKVVAPKYSGYLFSSTYTGKQLKNVTEIEGLSQLDTSNVTDMRCMFSDMRSVINLDVSGFDTSNVTSMNYMFKNMSSITSLDVSGFDTSNVTGMYTMFQGLSRVTSLDLSNFDTHKVTDMRDMFVDTPLKKLILGDTFKFVESGSENAKLTSAWKREDGTGKVYTAEDFMKNYGTGDLTAGTYVSVETGTWGTSPYMFDENTGVLTIEAGELSGYEESPWNSDKVVSESIKKIVLAGKVVAPEDSSNLFSYSYLKNVTEIDGLSQLDTSNVTDMREMFRGMNSITSLDLSGFDTSKVTTMGSMFKNTPLAKLTLGDHFKAVGDTGLSAPKALNEGDQLTGNWIREDGQSKGYSPADFMTNYGTGDLTAGTYVAELVKSELKPQEYHVGDVNITGTYTGDMSLGRLTVNGKVVSWGGSFKDGQFSYYVGAGKLKVGDKVVLDGYNKEKELIDSKEIEVISESSGSIDQVDTYKLGDSTITGTYTGDIHKGKLVVNGEVISWGGTYKDGKFSYYVNSQIIKAGDQATIQGYDKFDTPLGDPQPVTIGEQLGQLTEAHRVGISTVIEGNYTGDVYQGILLVNGEKVSQGGSFKDGKFSYYVGNLKVSEDDQVVLMGANNRGQQIPGSEIGVTIQTPTAEINELTYKLGTQTIKGAYGSDTQVHQGHLFVNGKLISKGGSFKDGAISYYVKPDLIKADDQVTMNFYDGSGNLLAENQTVSVN